MASACAMASASLAAWMTLATNGLFTSSRQLSDIGRDAPRFVFRHLG